MIWNVGPYVMTIIGDTVAVTDVRRPFDMDNQSDWTLPETKVEGLGKLVAKGVDVRLFMMDDMPLIYIIQKGHKYGYGYSINLAESAFSEFGDTGVFIPKD